MQKIADANGIGIASLAVVADIDIEITGGEISAAD